MSFTKLIFEKIYKFIANYVTRNFKGFDIENNANVFAISNIYINETKNTYIFENVIYRATVFQYRNIIR